MRVRLADNNSFTFQYVSINTENEFFKKTRSSSFTFQYVSINTGKTAQREWRIDAFTFQYVSINTPSVLVALERVYLYIPICFY